MANKRINMDDLSRLPAVDLDIQDPIPGEVWMLESADRNMHALMSGWSCAPQVINTILPMSTGAPVTVHLLVRVPPGVKHMTWGALVSGTFVPGLITARTYEEDGSTIMSGTSDLLVDASGDGWDDLPQMTLGVTTAQWYSSGGDAGWDDTDGNRLIVAPGGTIDMTWKNVWVKISGRTANNYGAIHCVVFKPVTNSACYAENIPSYP